MEKLLNEVLGETIKSIVVDEREINLAEKEIHFCDKITLVFLSKNKLDITTDDIPHFYGEGDLNLNLEKLPNVNYQPNWESSKITRIKIFYWQPLGFFMREKDKYLVQIEFYQKEEFIISVGFFFRDFSTNKWECLITGELAINMQDKLNKTLYSKNLREIEIVL